jgi:hypothetical protein
MSTSSHGISKSYILIFSLYFIQNSDRIRGQTKVERSITLPTFDSSTSHTFFTSLTNSHLTNHQGTNPHLLSPRVTSHAFHNQRDNMIIGPHLVTEPLSATKRTNTHLTMANPISLSLIKSKRSMYCNSFVIPRRLMLISIRFTPIYHTCIILF